MDSNDKITATQFSSFYKCATKTYLLTIGEQITDADFSEMVANVSSLYKHFASDHLLSDNSDSDLCNFDSIFINKKHAHTNCYVDSATVVLDISSSNRKLSDLDLVSNDTTIPVLFIPWDKPDVSDHLLTCFGALALAQITGTLPKIGTLVYGDGCHRKTVKIEKYITQTTQIIDAIKAIRCEHNAPTLVLNRHCAVCEFQQRCRNIAIERDDLSLLTAMTAKERAKCNAKGIFTITQLSYGYRPRRRRRTSPDAKPSKAVKEYPAAAVKNDVKLKALAIKKRQTHVVGDFSLRFNGTPVFLDVEGMPDRDFYYLIGLRFESDNGIVERSFWADRSDDERAIWQSCLSTLRQIENVQIVSYGAYESKFLKNMKKRYCTDQRDIDFIDKLHSSLINLVQCIYGRIYFPTFSNGLKEICRYLGFEWNSPRVSGATTPILRRAWELGIDKKIRDELINYNIDDCRADASVAEHLVKIGADGAIGLAVDVSSLEAPFRASYGKLVCALPEFQKINNAAYWDYQRSKVYARTNNTVKRAVNNINAKNKTIKIQKNVILGPNPTLCTKCQSSSINARNKNSYLVYDLNFIKDGIKRWFVRYHYAQYHCSDCGNVMTTYTAKPLYGPNLRALFIYLMFELHLSNQKAANHASLLFDSPLTAPNAQHIKSTMAEKYLPTYREILRQIANGPLIHADETKGVIRGGGHYIWAFANLTTVAYVYSESREATVLEEVLAGFGGVLVSDFYAAYDSVPCAQQKCLIHLMRDINEELHSNPFDEELKDIARRFGSILRMIVETIDRYGLKSRHLRKHKLQSEEFIEHVVAMQCSTEAGLALKKRIRKNRTKLFTFLEYDNVPWNNNNAEHALRAFTRLRNVMTISTPKGHREYATLLSIQQTLRYRGLDFLEFLRSGRMEIDDRNERIPRI